MESEIALYISRFLSFTVVLTSVFAKWPQVAALLASGSAEGMNLRSYWLESAIYLIGFFYGYTYDYHLSIYVEAGLLAVQNAVIIVLVMNYNKKWTIENLLYILLSVSFTIASFCKLVPHLVMNVLLSSTLPLMITSKVSQIWTIYQLKSCGDISVFPWAFATYVCVARIYSILVEVGDLQILFIISLATILNAIIVALCLYYGKVPKKHE